MEVESDSVVIQWTVAYISYSPETYVVQYGTSRETLVHNSSRRASEVGTTTYSVPLSGLRDNTTYYVQVLATNTALRSTRSTVENFTTLSTMELASGVCKHLWGACFTNHYSSVFTLPLFCANEIPSFPYLCRSVWIFPGSSSGWWYHGSYCCSNSSHHYSVH